MRIRPSIAILLAGALALVALPAAAQKVYIDYDHEAQLDKYKTFTFVPNPEGDLSKRSPLMHKRILDALRAQIGANLTEAASNPDLAVTYHVTLARHRPGHRARQSREGRQEDRQGDHEAGREVEEHAGEEGLIRAILA
jgi:hypothetical protein